MCANAATAVCRALPFKVLMPFLNMLCLVSVSIVSNSTALRKWTAKRSHPLRRLCPVSIIFILMIRQRLAAEVLEVALPLAEERHATFTSVIVRFSDENETPSLRTFFPERSNFSA